MIMIAMNQTIDAEKKWMMGDFSVDAEIQDFGLDRRAEDRR